MLPGNSINLIYIDGTDAASEGTFVSSETGAVMSYMNWIVGEPNNCCGGEHCLNMYSEHNGLWNDIGCETPLASVCEIENSKFEMIGTNKQKMLVFFVITRMSNGQQDVSYHVKLHNNDQIMSTRDLDTRPGRA